MSTNEYRSDFLKKIPINPCLLLDQRKTKNICIATKNKAKVKHIFFNFNDQIKKTHILNAKM